MARYGTDFSRPWYRGTSDYGAGYYGGYRYAAPFYGGTYGADYYGRYGVRDFDVNRPADGYGAGQAYWEEQYRRPRPGRRTEGMGGYGGRAFYGGGESRDPYFVDTAGFQAGPIGGSPRARGGYGREYGRPRGPRWGW